MKTLIILAFILIALLTALSMSQTTSNITYDAGSDIFIGTGADVCADQVIINGTFSGTGTICGGVMPISLLSFNYTVDKRDVKLNWVTEWELNNSGFDIERKTGNEQWKKIGFVPGGGTTTQPKIYRYVDPKLRAGKYEYRLKQIDYSGGSEYYNLSSEVTVEPPGSFSLGQNYPNPGNPKTKINFEIPAEGRVTIKVYDAIGREVVTLLDENKPADYYTIEFDGSGFASGVYFYRINASGFTAVKKMLVVK